MRSPVQIVVMAVISVLLLPSSAAAFQGPWFAPPASLSAAGQSASGPQVAVAPDGTTTATWARSNGANFIIQAIFTANPPAARAAPTVTGIPALGAALTCDGGLWTGAAQVTIQWLRGATAAGAGATYTITTADQGQALACRATATNQFGTLQSLSAAVSVAPASPAVSVAPASPALTPPPPSPPEKGEASPSDRLHPWRACSCLRSGAHAMQRRRRRAARGRARRGLARRARLP